MKLVQVYTFYVQTPQTLPGGLHDPVWPEGRRYFGSDNRVMAPSSQCLTKNFFRPAVTVHRGGIEEVDSQLQRPMDDPNSLFVI